MSHQGAGGIGWNGPRLDLGGVVHSVCMWKIHPAEHLRFVQKMNTTAGDN